MPFRLAGSSADKPIRFTLKDGTTLVGSADDCDVRLHDPTVSRAHAAFDVASGRVRVRDLDSRNGTFLGERRIVTEDVEPGAVIAIGRVKLVLEEVDAGDLRAGVALPGGSTGEPDETAREPWSTVRTKPVETFTIEKLPALLRLAAEHPGIPRAAQAGAAALYDTLPILQIDARAGGSRGAVLFAAERGAGGPGATAATASNDDVSLRVVFPDEMAARTLFPLLEVVAAVVALAAAAPQESRRAAAACSPPAPPEPASVVEDVQRLYAEAAQVARGDVGVLIVGESGTGKEVLARYVHAASERAGGPFVALNCAALPRDLLETELFGIERGVATGVDARAGKFELAHQGTLFLDEIGDMALETQAKLLRVLQEKSVHRLGGAAARPAQVRVVAATNRDMRALLAARTFREDLFYRIATWTAEIPPLRHRRADIPNLAVHFLAREAARRGVRVTGISEAALERLTAYDWPGNVRQMENEMARCVLFLGDGQMLDTARLGDAIRNAEPSAAGSRLSEALERAEREEIEQALKATDGDTAKAAARLGIGRSTLYRRLKALGLVHDVPPTGPASRD